MHAMCIYSKHILFDSHCGVKSTSNKEMQRVSNKKKEKIKRNYKEKVKFLIFVLLRTSKYTILPHVNLNNLVFYLNQNLII